MKLEAVWTTIVYVFDVLTLQSPTRHESQAALSQPQLAQSQPPPKFEVFQSGGGDGLPVNAEVISEGAGADDGKPYFMADGSPAIPVPRNPQDGERRITCEYPKLAAAGWENCHGPGSRGCWLRNRRLNKEFGINSDNEKLDEVPEGKVRKFKLDVSEQPLSPDGLTQEHGKVFNRTYPGPWLQACWGDYLEVEITNNLRWNGTSVHWHGFRQYKTMHEDGVNGITECPIAPGDTWVYKFRAMQYGSAWYHSHYSLQYGDGLLGPITIYGPATSDYGDDLIFRPLLMTDWNHRSVFEDWPLMLESGSAPEMTNILINGTGQFGPGSKLENKYQVWLNRSQRHHMTLINTAVDTTFVFSIDNHHFEVISSDFVPIRPYNTSVLKVGIGQRYHIIVFGLDEPYEFERNGNFWMRTTPARKCSKFSFWPDDQTGLIRYDPDSKRSVSSLSEPEPYDIHCDDESMKKLIPWKPWIVKDPVNIDPKWTGDSDIPRNKAFIFDVHLMQSGGPGTNTPYIPDDKPYTRWSMHDAPFRINFSDPTIFNLDNLTGLIKQPHLDVITYDSVDEEQWIWMVITAPEKVPVNGGRIFVPAAHPMHLHGHDFALLQQTTWPWYDDFGPGGTNRQGFYREYLPGKMNCANRHINCKNPTRRDVVLLPAGGFVIIAFKADNPGAWIIHCHIAFHASHGLAIQIIENKDKIPPILKEDMPRIKQRCENWQKWHSNPMNLWDYRHPSHFQDDSGV